MQLQPARRALGVLVVASALSAFSQAAYATVGVNKSFTPNSVVAGQSATLTITLLNPNSSSATGVALTDTLPNGVVVANPLNVVSNSCGFSTASIVPGTRPIPLSGGTIPGLSGGVPGQCSIALDVVSATPNTYLNTIAAGSVASSQGSNSQDAQATLVVSAPLPVTGSKAFAPTNVHGNGPVSRLTITLTNPNAIALTNAAITDTLPANITVASGVGEPNPATTCAGGTATASPAATNPATIALSGGTIPASGSCTLAVDVVARNPNALVNGNQTNTVNAGSLSTTQGVTNTAFSANINVQTGGSLAKAFAPTPIAPNGASTLTVTVTDFNSTALTPITFTDTFPAAITATGVASSNTCGGVITTTPAVPPFTSFTITGGSLAGVVGAAAGSTTCQIVFPVTASATATNTIPANNYGGVAIAAASGTLSVSAITGSKAFTVPAIQTGSTTMTITLNNLTAAIANITVFTDLLTTMGSGFTVSGATSNTCGSTITAAIGGTSITTSNGSIPAGGSCTITVPIAISATASTGTRTNTIAANAIHTSVGNNTVAITGSVNVQRALTTSKAFNPATIQGGAVSRLTVTLAPTVNLTGVGFTDDLTGNMGAGFVVGPVPNVVLTNCGGATFSAAAGATGFSMSGGTLTAGSNCTFAVNVATPASTGTFTNHIPAANFVTTEGVTTSDTNANLVLINSSVTVNKSFSPTTVPVGSTALGNPNFSTLSIQIRNNNAGAINLTGVAFTDALPQVGALGMVVANPPTASFTGAGCSGATITAPVGATSISVSGANVNANSICTLSVRVVGTISGNLINTVNAGTVTSTQGVSNPLQGTATLAVTGSVNLTVTKTDGVASVVPGTTTTYTVVVSNAGPNSVAGLGVNDTPPAGMTFTSWTCAATAGSNCPASGSGPIAASVGILNGGSVTFTISAAIASSATGSISNTVSLAVPGSVIDTNPTTSATDTDSLTPQADLAITKDDGVASAVPGTSVTYTIVASNNGPSDAPGATVTDNFPATITSASWTCVASAGSSCPAAGSGNINTLVNLLAGGKATFTVNAAISSTALGTLSNTATVTAPAGVTDLVPGNNSATDNDSLTPQADLAITKTDGKSSVSAGGSTVYTIVASNNGPSAVTGATVADTAPAGLTLGSWTCSASAGSSCPASGSGNISASVNLLVGGTATFTVNATVAGNATGTISNTATISVPPGVVDLIPGNNSATDSDTVTLVADLAITKDDGKTSVNAGGSTVYTIVATNNGPSAVTGATVTDTAPAALTFGSWTCAATAGSSCPASGSGNISASVNLLAGGSATFTVNATVAGNATGTITNTATIAVPAGVSDPTPGNNSASDSDTVNLVADLSITKDDGKLSVVPGTSTTYTIVVSNAGPSVVSGATVTDLMPATIASDTYTATASGGATGFTASGSGNIADTVNMPVGSTITYTVVANVSPSATGTLSNTATVTAPVGVTDPTPGNNSATDSDTLTAQADLSITKDDGKLSVVPGTSTTYTIVVKNNGPSNVTGAAVSDVMPAAIASDTFTATASGGATGFTASGSGNIADTVNMPAGSMITYTVVANVSAGASGTLSNTATVTAPSGVTDPTPGNNSATDSDSLTPQADLAITKTDGVSSINAGASTSYTIVVTNNGPSAANNAVFTDPAVANLNVTSVTCGSALNGAACPAPANTTVALMQGAGIVIPTLPATGSVTFTVNATVAGSATGTITNTATIAAPGGVSDPTPGNNSASDSDTVNLVADLSITKTDGTSSAVPGNPTTYTIIVSNAGPSGANGATVSDTMPAEVASDTFTAAATGGATGFTASGSGNINDTVNLPAGSTITYTVVTHVDPAATGTLTNTATVTAPGSVTDPDNTNNSATDSDTLTPQVDLVVKKTDGSTSYTPGGMATYTVTITNNGPSDAANVTLTDNFPAGLTLSADASCVANGSASCGSVTGTLGQTSFGTTGAQLGAGAGDSLVFTAPVAFASGMTTNPLQNTATATDLVTTNTASDTDSDTLAPNVSLSVFKTDGSTTYTPGGTATYTITITDTGVSDATNVTVTDNLPAGVSLSGNASCVANGTADCGAVTGTTGQFSLGTTGAKIPVGAGNSIVFTAPVAFAPAMTTDPLDNKADATDLLSGATGSSTDSDALALGVSLAVSKTDGSPTYVPGGAATYTITVTNTGLSDATDVTVTDTLPGGVTLTGNATCAPNGTASCGTVTGTTGQMSLGTTGAHIPAGAGNSLVFTAPVAFAANMLADPLINSATASDGPSGASGSGSDSDGRNATADLAITKSDGVTTAVPGQSVTYSIVVSNTGPSDVVGATVADTLPAAIASATWTCVAAGGGTCTASGSGNINDTVNLPVGATLTYTLVANIAPSATGNLSNTASVAAPAGVTDSNPGNNSATDTDTLAPQADLAITKTDGVTTVNPGQAVTYTIVASNSGPSAVAGANVSDTLPASLTGATWTCAASAGSACPASGSGNINALVNLLVGGTATFTLNATVSPSASGSISNTAVVTAPAGVTDTNPGNNSATDVDTVVIILLPDLTLTKTHSGNFVAGQTGTYTITVSNVGSAPTSGTVTVTDVLPAGLTVAAMSGTGWACVVATATCTRSDALAAGTSYPLITLVVNVAGGATGTLINNVTVSGGGDANGGNNAASDSVSISPRIGTVAPIPALDQTMLLTLILLIGLAAVRRRWR
jgi:uncharacterized repeat protein (TIGR01451 family)